MTIRTRLHRLEKVSPKSGKHYLFVRARPGESQDQALQRHLDDKGITLDNLGCAFVIGGEFGLAEIDNGGYERLENLIGWREAGKVIDQLIKDCEGTSTQAMIRQREQS